MHYIRFLKQPRLISSSNPNPTSPPKLSAKVTITTDLGETFLFESILVLAQIQLPQGSNEWISVADKEVLWTAKAGYTGLEIEVPLPKSKKIHKSGNMRMVIRAKEPVTAWDSLDRLPEKEHDGSVVSVYSMAVGLDNNKPPLGQPIAERVFSAAGTEIHIWEETGESIARHIWDAGLILSSYLSLLSNFHTRVYDLPKMPLLQSTLQKSSLKILELGAGCGIVGITLSTLYPNVTQTLLTDLPEATSILSHNLSLSNSPPSSQVSHQILDWSLPLSQSISSTCWDLVVIADCTYNPDVVPDLVQTLERIVGGKQEVFICLAMKVRHESEMAFFDLMARTGFEVRESVKIPLPVLGGEGEVIEIFGFVFRGVSVIL